MLNGPAVAVDAHVHLYRMSRVGPTLAAAASNFGASGAPPAAGIRGVLLLTQGARERIFEQLVDKDEHAGWTLTRCPTEPQSLLARRGEETLCIVNGRQVRADDGLEVLALGTCAVIPDGLRFAAALEHVQSTDALPVIPWGFGKWWGARGRRVLGALAANGPDTLFLGDNASRLALAPAPAFLRAAAAEGFRILPGTDPFPFAADERRVGSFGFRASIVPSLERPFSALRTWLLGRATSPPAYGGASSLPRFVINQVGIHAWNRLKKRSQQ
jgi:hypothetical protein